MAHFQHSVEDRRRAARAVIEEGSVRAAARACELSEDVIYAWKSRHPEEWARYTADAQADIEGRPRALERTSDELSGHLGEVGRLELKPRGIIPSLPFLSGAEWDFAEEVWGFTGEYLLGCYVAPK